MPTEKDRQRQKNWYEKNRDTVLKRVANWQKENHEQYIAYQRANREANIEARRAQSRKWKADNIEKHREISRGYSRKHAEEISDKRKAARRELKQRVINAYGGACACCDEKAIEFLTIDHVGGDGAAHLKALGIRKGSSDKLYRVLIAENFPDGFRVLCFNCNSARGFYGYCPHNPEDKTGVPLHRFLGTKRK